MAASTTNMIEKHDFFFRPRPSQQATPSTSSATYARASRCTRRTSRTGYGRAAAPSTPCGPSRPSRCAVSCTAPSAAPRAASMMPSRKPPRGVWAPCRCTGYSSYHHSHHHKHRDRGKNNDDDNNDRATARSWPRVTGQESLNASATRILRSFATSAMATWSGTTCARCRPSGPGRYLLVVIAGNPYLRLVISIIPRMGVVGGWRDRGYHQRRRQ